MSIVTVAAITPMPEEEEDTAGVLLMSIGVCGVRRSLVPRLVRITVTGRPEIDGESRRSTSRDTSTRRGL